MTLTLQPSEGSGQSIRTATAQTFLLLLFKGTDYLLVFHKDTDVFSGTEYWWFLRDFSGTLWGRKSGGNVITCTWQLEFFVLVMGYFPWQGHPTTDLPQDAWSRLWSLEATQTTHSISCGCVSIPVLAALQTMFISINSFKTAFRNR